MALPQPKRTEVGGNENGDFEEGKDSPEAADGLFAGVVGVEADHANSPVTYL
jgi:hypothetical protein